MSVRLRCPKAHEWEFVEGGSTLPLAAGQCPMCGLPSDQMSLVGTATLPIEVRTLPYSDSVSDSSAAPPGIAGYEVLAELGRGGMGVVYRARQLSLKREVALKLPHESLTASESQLDRFRREAESVAQLQHPNIVQVYDYGVHAGRPFFSMEYLDGGSLANRIANSHVPAPPAAHMVSLLARAVHAAHLAGVIHRDLKPANVLVTADGVPKVSDFGLALSFTCGGRDKADGPEGTPSYMAPEQAANEPEKIGPATDVYGLGAILYRLLTARPPFESRSIATTLEQVRNSEPIAPRQLQPTVPRDLEAICIKCLRKKPWDRYASAAELADDLDRFRRGDAVQARSAPLAEKSVRYARRRPLTIAGALLVLAGVIGGFWYWNAHYRETIEFFAEPMNRWGAPVGVRLLSAEDVRHREASLRFHSRGARVQRIEVIDATGKLTTRHTFSSAIAGAESWMEPSRRECQFEYTYDAGGHVLTEVAKDALGDVVWSFQYTSPTAGFFKDRNGYPSPQTPSGATYVQYTFSPEGRTARERYCDVTGAAKPDGLGRFGVNNEFAANGRTTRTMFIGADDKPVLVPLGVAGFGYGYDDLGNLRRAEMLNADESRGTAVNGVSVVQFDRDKWGNLTRYSYFDRFEKPCLWSGQYHYFTIDRDDRGRATWIRLFDIGDHSIRGVHGYASVFFDFGDGNLPLKQIYYDEHEQRCNSPAGFGRIDRKFDRRGEVLEESYFDRENKPVIGEDGWHKIVRRLVDGDVVEQWTWLPDDKPAPDAAGIAHKRMAYNEYHKQVRVEFLDIDSVPISSPTSRIAGWSTKYDSNGHQIERRFFGLDGNPRMNNDGIAGFDMKYDADGREVERRFVEVSGKPCRNVAWSYGLKFEYKTDGSRREINVDREGLELISRVIVLAIEPGFGADRAGLHVGDVILSFAGQDVRVQGDIAKVLNDPTRASETHEVKIRRDGQALTIQLPHRGTRFTISDRMLPP